MLPNRLSLLAVLALAACTDSRLPTESTSRSAVQLSTVSNASVAVIPNTGTISPGLGVQLAATMRDALGQPQLDTRFTWSSDNPAIGTVSSSGRVLAVTPGTFTITATAFSDPAITGTATFTVVPRNRCVQRGPNLHVPQPTTPAPTGYEDTPFVFQMTADDADLPCDELTYRIRWVPTGGFFHQVAPDGSVMTSDYMRPDEVVTNPDRWVAFVPYANASSDYSVGFLGYHVTDAAGHDSGLFYTDIQVIPVNDRPVAMASTHTGFNTINTTDVTIIPLDDEWMSIRVCITRLPRNGVLYRGFVGASQRVSAGDCVPETSFKYVVPYDALGCTVNPASSYPRSDDFVWYLTDGKLSSPAVTDRISIVYFSDPPVLTTTTASTKEDLPAAVSLTSSDQDGPQTGNNYPRYSIVSLPAHGTLWFGRTPIVAVPTLLSALAGVAPDLTYVPNADFNTGLETEEFRVQVRDVDVRNCDYVVRINIAAVNDAPVITGPASLSATVSGDGAVVPAQTSDIRVADDAGASDVLKVTLRAQGPAAARVDLLDRTGVMDFERVSSTEIRFRGTQGRINAALSRGVVWTPNNGGEAYGELVVVVDDRGRGGLPTPPVPLVTTQVIPVHISGDIDLSPP